MNYFTEDQVTRIANLVSEIEKLTDVEKLFLYLQLPCGRADKEDFENNNGRTNSTQLTSRTNFSDLFTKKPDQETTQTYTWILSHLEVDPNVSLPKQEVYDEYRAFCQANRFEPLCVADFGKAMKHAFPCIKPRRLGQRGNSRYCYSGLRKKYRLQPPSLPDLFADCRNTSAGLSIAAECNSNGVVAQSSQYTHSDGQNTCSFDQSPSHAGLRAARIDYNAGYEVMNLKVEAPTESSSASRLVYASMCGFTNGLDTSCLLTNSLDTDGIDKQQSPTSNSNQLLVQSAPVPDSLACINNSHIASPQPNLVAQPNHALSQQQCSPDKRHTELDLNEASSTRCSVQSYNSQHIVPPPPPQPARSPDDDDYRHNYQDMSPTIHRLGVFGETRVANDKVTPLQVNASDHLANSTGLNSNGFTYNHRNQAGTCNSRQTFNSQHLTQEIRNSASLCVKSNAAQGLNFNFNGPETLNHSPVDTGLTQTAPNHEVPRSLTGRASVGHHPELAIVENHQQFHHLTTFAGAHMDSCASPFQSPASTPYPGIASSGFVSNDLPDYCSDDCLRYQN